MKRGRWDFRHLVALYLGVSSWAAWCFAGAAVYDVVFVLFSLAEWSRQLRVLARRRPALRAEHTDTWAPDAYELRRREKAAAAGCCRPKRPQPDHV